MRQLLVLLLHGGTQLYGLYLLDHHLTIGTVLESGVGRQLLQCSQLRHWSSHVTGGGGDTGLHRDIGRS